MFRCKIFDTVTTFQASVSPTNSTGLGQGEEHPRPGRHNTVQGLGHGDQIRDLSQHDDQDLGLGHCKELGGSTLRRAVVLGKASA